LARALLKLLADPDLEHVELCVWRHHLAVFCPFHKEAEMMTKGNHLTESVDRFGLATIRGISDWVQLDWETMVKVLGTGERIVKIIESSL
jgi:hypothetical protein